MTVSLICHRLNEREVIGMVQTNGTVIVGGSIAGHNVARRLRKEGYSDKITMIEASNTLPYDRAELSTGWMQDADKVEPPLFQKKDFFEEQDITVKLNTEVVSFNPNEKMVETDDGQEIAYDKLVLATGSTLRKLDATGENTAGVFYLRNHEDALEIKEWAKQEEIKDLAIIGGGFIGLELAASFSKLGLNVTVIEYNDYPLGQIIGEEASKYFMDMHKAHGVKFITGEGGQAFEQNQAHQLNKVITTEGTEVVAQMAIIGVGVYPNVSVTHPDLEVDGGILVNEYGETSIPDVYAVGDVAVWPYQGKQIHVAHWENAYNQGQNVAKNIVEEKSHSYQTRPYFWTDQYDQTFERLGYMDSWDRIIQRGSFEDGKFTLAYVDEENYPLAILFANKADKRKEVAKFMDSGQAVKEESFKNLSNPLN